MNNKQLISIPFSISDIPSKSFDSADVDYTVPDGYELVNPNAVCATYKGIANAYYMANGKFSVAVFNVGISTATIDGSIYFWLVKQ